MLQKENVPVTSAETDVIYMSAIQELIQNGSPFSWEEVKARVLNNTGMLTVKPEPNPERYLEDYISQEMIYYNPSSHKYEFVVNRKPELLFINLLNLVR